MFVIVGITTLVVTYLRREKVRIKIVCFRIISNSSDHSSEQCGNHTLERRSQTVSLVGSSVVRSPLDISFRDLALSKTLVLSRDTVVNVAERVVLLSTDQKF